MKMIVIVPFARFSLGTVCLTPGADAVLEETGASLADLLTRHAKGDWGSLCPEDRKVNEEALRKGQRLLSSYELPDGQKLWLITEADRSATTALLPEEY